MISTLESTCVTVLKQLLPYRRGPEPESTHDPSAFGPQLHQLSDFVSKGEQILFVLPAFPCKSPNPAKVLGHLPDEGERLALHFLQRLCAEVEKVYTPGAKALICSDGHVFGDAINVPDPHIDEYSRELSIMLQREGLNHLDTFDLRRAFGNLSYDRKRHELETRYGPSVGELRAATRSDEQVLRLYRGITRFLVEDTADWQGSKAALQRECRQRAYRVIQRSQAWSELVAESFPEAVRLSIHPQPVGAAKFGIRFFDSENAWTTPWHSATLRHPDERVTLIRRDRAVAEGLRLVTRNGRPSHFVSY